jgi:hypothetical protein
LGLALVELILIMLSSVSKKTISKSKIWNDISYFRFTVIQPASQLFNNTNFGWSYPEAPSVDMFELTGRLYASDVRLVSQVRC